MRTARTASQPVERHAADWYPTPAPVTRALLGHVRFAGGIWEPACGDGRMARVLAEAGGELAATDLHDRGFGVGGVDFLGAAHALQPNIVTNPPFGKLATRFVRHALDLAEGKVAMLLSIDFLGSEGRLALFRRTPPANILIAARRFEMWPGDIVPPAGSGGSTETFAWFVWAERRHRAPETLTKLDWFDWRDFA